MEFKDYYQIIGVSKTASEDEIKRAFRKLAKKYHPDVSKEAGAEAKFKEVNEAYDVLRDPEKRKAYDQLGMNWKAGQQFNPNDFDFNQFKNYRGFQGFHGFQEAGVGNQDFGDFFESLFGGSVKRARRPRYQPIPQEGEDLHVEMQIDLEDAFHGDTKTVDLRVPELTPEGHWIEVSKTLKIKIPSGVMDNQQIRLSGQGAPGLNGGHSGDLYIKIHLRPHPLFRVEGKDLYLTVPITPWEAALGTNINVPTMAGELNVKLPAGARTHQKLRLKGKGLPGKPKQGDLFLELQIQTPQAENEKQRKAYEALAKCFDFNPRSNWKRGI